MEPRSIYKHDSNLKHGFLCALNLQYLLHPQLHHGKPFAVVGSILAEAIFSSPTLQATCKKQTESRPHPHIQGKAALSPSPLPMIKEPSYRIGFVGGHAIPYRTHQIYSDLWSEAA